MTEKQVQQIRKDIRPCATDKVRSLQTMAFTDVVNFNGNKVVCKMLPPTGNPVMDAPWVVPVGHVWVHADEYKKIKPYLVNICVLEKINSDLRKTEDIAKTLETLKSDISCGYAKVNKENTL